MKLSLGLKKLVWSCMLQRGSRGSRNQSMSYTHLTNFDQVFVQSSSWLAILIDYSAYDSRGVNIDCVELMLFYHGIVIWMQYHGDSSMGIWVQYHGNLEPLPWVEYRGKVPWKNRNLANFLKYNPESLFPIRHIFIILAIFWQKYYRSGKKILLFLAYQRVNEKQKCQMSGFFLGQFLLIRGLVNHRILLGRCKARPFILFVYLFVSFSAPTHTCF